MAEIRCEFCGRMFDPAGVTDPGRHPCCGVRSAGKLAGALKAACRIRGELGRGASGAVYLADQLRLQRPVALKLLYANSTESAEKLFFSEVRAAGKLQHPNIVRIYSSGETDEQIPYSVMEYIDGETLEEMLDRGERFSEPELRRIASEIAGALSYAWETAGLTHGDLKPANVMLRRKDRSVCILDLGLQAARKENGISSAMGTPLYAAPELVNAAFGGCDFKSDVYSLGIMIYELLSGKAPFEGTPEELGRMHQNMDAEPLRKKVPSVSPEFSDLVSSMLVRYAPERPDWAAVLQRLRNPDPVPVPVRKSRKISWFLRAVWCFFLLSAGAAAGMTAGAYLPPELKGGIFSLVRPVVERGFLLAEQGNAAELEKMLKLGFPVNAANDQGNTILMQSVFFNREEVVRLLLQYDPDLQHRNKQGETVFDLAADFPVIEQLLLQKLQENNHAGSAKTQKY